MLEVKPIIKLYHGTSKQYEQSIAEKGLISDLTDNVHLTSDLEVAKRFSQKGAFDGYGGIVYEVDCPAMVADGYIFYQSPVVLHTGITNHVPPKYLNKMDKEKS